MTVKDNPMTEAICKKHKLLLPTSRLPFMIWMWWSLWNTGEIGLNSTAKKSLVIRTAGSRQVKRHIKIRGLILLSAIFRRGNPSVVALVRAGTVACPYSGRR